MNKSPFPGMDPYLESLWPEVHARLIVYAANQLNAQLPDDLQANIEENLSVHADEAQSAIRPDIHVSHDSAHPASDVNQSTAIIAEPLVVRRAPHPTRHIEIIDKDGRVITAIEFISPWNKVGSRAREQYTRKQLHYIEAGINLVEIDLVRQGAYVLAAPLEDLHREQRTPYLICVYRDAEPDQYEVYRAPLQEPLPNIPVPLRYRERDAVLQLQPLIDQCYQDGRYHRLDYSGQPHGKFNEELTQWIKNQLQIQGRQAT
jgi:hypothetical protein